MASIFIRGRVWWISYYPAPGSKPIQKSLKTKDKTVAKFRKNEIENKLTQGESPIHNTNKTAQDCFDEFKQHRAGRISKKARDADHYRILKFISDEKIGHINHITEARVKRHLDKRQEGKSGISPRTANHTIRTLNTFLNFCVKRKYLTENPLKGMIRYPVNIEEPRFLSPEEINKLLKAAKESPLYSLIMTAIYTGMRYGELERLEWSDVDFKNEIITVKLSKAKRFRKIPLHHELAMALKPLAGDGKCFPLEQHQFEWQLALVKNNANIPHFRFHDLRHTFASIMIRSGVDILTVSKLLGHGDIKTTQIYAHLYQDHIKDSVRKFKI